MSADSTDSIDSTDPAANEFGARLRELREAPPYWSRSDLARRIREAAHPGDEIPHVASLVASIKQWESGQHMPGRKYRPLLARALGVSVPDLFGTAPGTDSVMDDELDALELARRVAASDVGADTLDRLEAAFDDLATAYQGTPPGVLLDRTRRHLGYVGRLLDGHKTRKTLAEHRRLVVAGGWLSLLAATCHIDLDQRAAGAARLRTAARLAREADHAELAAWCLETRAWQALTHADHRGALALAQAAREAAPRGSSAYVQATAQEGRVWARLGDGPQTRNALTRVARLVSPMPVPDRPEHHYRYDPAKSDAYTATTLAWVGDPAAVEYAREVLARLEHRPRRAASARLDLALALLATDEPDEAVAVTMESMASGRLVPSNHWRAAEIIAAVEARRLASAAELRDAYREFCGR
ncbi:transcriptional regulator [Spongiactinospora rosea]|uniref:Transcriptional regulator n=1 Tax=Spongiactinospora rosea TaxID=2248750 RepID=A0A366LZ54_9ACTN|nr:helix-turn-helix transcriptional regulator [Spongiactinospora rosea]RBQ18594.1 transcriptional regulator [Spongiactinospora rosea]